MTQRKATIILTPKGFTVTFADGTEQTTVTYNTPAQAAAAAKTWKNDPKPCYSKNEE